MLASAQVRGSQSTEVRQLGCFEAEAGKEQEKVFNQILFHRQTNGPQKQQCYMQVNVCAYCGPQTPVFT